MGEKGRAFRAWPKVRGSFPGPIFVFRVKWPIDWITLHVLMKKYGAAAGIPEHLETFSCAKTFLRHALVIERFRRESPALDRAREHSIDHGIRQGDQCTAG